MDNDKYTEIDSKFDLYGHSIKIVKDGLDIEDVTALVKELIDERDGLAKRQENLGALTKLYEKTIIEAGEMAKQIEKEARERVQRDAGNILNQAHQRAKAMVEQQQAEANQFIRQRLKSIQEKVKEQLETLHKRELEKLRSSIKETAQLIFDEIVAHEKDLAGQEDFTESVLDENSFDLFPGGEPAKAGESVPSPDMKEGQPTTPSAGGANISPAVKNDDVKVKPEATQNVPPGPETDNAPSPTAANKGPSIVHVTGKMESDYTEVEILPPHTPQKIENIEKSLSKLPEIRKAELQHVNDKNVIKVTFNRYIDLVTALRNLPDVSRTEDSTKEGRRRVLVTLGEKEKSNTNGPGLSKKIIDALNDEG